MVEVLKKMKSYPKKQKNSMCKGISKYKPN